MTIENTGLGRGDDLKDKYLLRDHEGLNLGPQNVHNRLYSLQSYPSYREMGGGDKKITRSLWAGEAGETGVRSSEQQRNPS